MKLFNDSDPLRKGLSFYLVASHLKEKGLQLLKPMLGDPSQLLRYEAISALMEQGGAAGRAMVLERRGAETQPFLKKIYEQIKKPGGDQEDHGKGK
jgi:hypothetical protein